MGENLKNIGRTPIIFFTHSELTVLTWPGTSSPNMDMDT